MKASTSPKGLTAHRILAVSLASFTIWACSAGGTVDQPEDDAGSTTTTTTTTTTGTGGNGGAGGEDPGLCGQDCSLIDSPPCLMSVCNDGTYPGAVGQCVVVPEAAGTACDDGLFCTVDDACDGSGVCMGGPQNTCGMTDVACQNITCDENGKSCGVENADEGSACTPADLCQTGGTCTAGQCVGTVKDCFFAPTNNDCEIAVCDPQDGMCKPEADPNLDGQPCFVGDLCAVGKTCASGVCQGGLPKDCSALDQATGCFDGVCNPVDGQCTQVQQAVGMPCSSASDACNQGTCDANQNCVGAPVPNGTACTDFNSCTTGNTCQNGTCGTLDPMCTILYEENFESCPPPGMTISGNVWECGMASTSGPSTAQQGTNILGTDLQGDYPTSMAYANDYVETPPIDLSTNVTPVLTWWQWMHTEGSTYDGYNVKISTDSGQTFSVLNTVSPPYNLTVDSQPAYGGDESAQGWNQRSADLAPFVGGIVILRFSMRTDTSVVYPGVFIDDIKLEETSGPTVPVVITTASLPGAFVGDAYSVQLERTGGTQAAVWSIVGGTNHSWLSINSSGVLSGTPAAGNVGPVSVTIRLEESPTNFVEQTFNFEVLQSVYFEDFDTACPAGWTLASSWQCGAPTSGPNAAFSGTNVIATNLTGDYANGLAWATNTATSPTISTSGTSALLRFRVWYNTEGSTYDGWNVKVSTDNGATFSLLTNVTPVYSLTVDTQVCWGGDQSANGWQEYVADLSSVAGQAILLQFAMRTDTSVQRPGVYIDDVEVFD